MATREDAHLVVQLMRWGTEMGLEDALRLLFSEDFDTTSAEAEPAVAKTLFFGETVATLVKHDLLDGDLVRDLLWVEGIWERVAEHARAVRAKEDEPRLYENLEALVGVPASVGAA
jgi:hypothetical protein